VARLFFPLIAPFKLPCVETVRITKRLGRLLGNPANNPEMPVKSGFSKFLSSEMNLPKSEMSSSCLFVHNDG